MRKVCIILMISVLGMVMLIGCASSDKSSNTIMYDQAIESVPEQKTEVTTENVATQDMQLNLGSSLNRKVIKTGHLDVETKQFEQTINALFEKVEKEGGFVETCDISGSSLYSPKSYRYANMTVRIPQKDFEAFINTADQLGNVVRRGIAAQDITDAYVDTETRMKALEVRRDRLMALLEKSGTLEELFKIEQELANVNYEIETLKGTLGKYDLLIDFASVQITVSEVELYQDVPKPVNFSQKIKDTFKESLKSLVTFGKAGVLIVVALSPYLIILGIPVGVIIGIWSKHRKKSKDQEKQE